MIRVLLVDDHHLVRAGVTSLLQSDPGIAVVGEAQHGREALELLQWRQERETFEDLAVEYAVAFEQSPPSWEPPPTPPAAPADAASAPAAEEEGTLPADVEMLVWTGVMAGAALAYFTRLADFAQRRAIVPVDMSGVERVDFVCA